MTTKNNEERICRLCNEKKSIKEFEIDKRVKGGITSRCKACKAGLNDKARVLYSSLKHRASKSGQPLEVTLKELRALLAAFDGKCVYCNATEEEAMRTHHVDHIIAISKGGRHHISNLVVSCGTCNMQKRNRPFFEFYKAKKDEIGDENFTALLYYVAYTSGQPLKEVFSSFAYDYIEENYTHVLDVLNADEVKEQLISDLEMSKTERAS